MTTTPVDATLQPLLSAIARHDAALFARLLSVKARVLSTWMTKQSQSALRRWEAIVRRCHADMVKPTLPEHRLYARLRLRYRMDHTESLSAAGLLGSREQFTMYETDLLMPVFTALEEERAALIAETDISKKDVLNGLLAAVACARDSTELVNAWREIGKLLGHYEETKVRVTQTVKQEITKTLRFEAHDLRTFTDEQLLAHLDEDARTLLLPLQPREVLPLEPATITRMDAEPVRACIEVDHRERLSRADDIERGRPDWFGDDVGPGVAEVVPEEDGGARPDAADGHAD